jgi:hypothetical protein
MPRLSKLAALTLCAGLLAFGCTESEGPLEPLVPADLAPQLGLADGEVVAELIAGRHIDAGDVRLWNDADYIYVEFTAAGDWCLLETHLHVAEVLADIPQTKKGNPIPGAFDYADAHDCITDYTLMVPLSWDVGTPLVVAAHAVVSSPAGTETAWARDGDNLEFPGKNWATYIGFEVEQWEIRVLLYYGNGGFLPGDFPSGAGDLFELEAHYLGLGAIVDYTDDWPDDLSAYKLVLLHGPGWKGDGGENYFSAGQKSQLTDYMRAGGRVVLQGDHSGLFGVNTVNDLLAGLAIGIVQNADRATHDTDICAPITDITADQVTDGLTQLDPSATSSLTLSGTAKSLARIDDAPYTCTGGVSNGVTFMAVDQVAGAPARPGGDIIVIGDINMLDDPGFEDWANDGTWSAELASNLLNY